MWITDEETEADLLVAASDLDVTGLYMVHVRFTEAIVETFQTAFYGRHFSKLYFYSCSGTDDVLASLRCMTVDELRVDGMSLTDSAALALAGILMEPNSSTPSSSSSASAVGIVQQLVFQDIPLTQPLADAIRIALQGTTTLKSLVWNHGTSQIPFHHDDESTRSAIDSLILQGIRNNISLDTLELNCILSDACVVELLKVVSTHSTLKKVYLRLQNATQETRKALEQLFSKREEQKTTTKKAATTTKNLSLLEHLKLTIDGDFIPLCTNLANNADTFSTSPLRLSLELSSVNTMDDIDHLGRLLVSNPFIEQLDLGHSGITNLGFCALAPSLAMAHGLKRLHIYGNSCGTTGAEAILDAVRANTMLQAVQLPYQCPLEKQITNLADVNRGGRRLLLNTVTAPVALWPRVLERAGTLQYTLGPLIRGNYPRQVNVVYQLLRETAALQR